MHEPKTKLPNGYENQENPKSRSEDIHFLVKQIKKESYSSIKFVDKRETDEITQVKMLDYCDKIYRLALTNENTSDAVKSLRLSENDSIANLAYSLENFMNSNHYRIFDIEDDYIVVEESIDAFNSYQAFNLNLAFVKSKMDLNLKIGLAHCLQSIIYFEYPLFSIPELEYITDLENEYAEEEHEGLLTVKSLKEFEKLLLAYEKEFDKLCKKKYKANIKYTDAKDLETQEIINKLLSFDRDLITSNLNNDEMGDGYAPFEEVFVITIENVDEVADHIFYRVLEMRCSSLGEMGTQSLSQFKKVTNDEIIQMTKEEDIIKIQEYESHLEALCKILKNNYEQK